MSTNRPPHGAPRTLWTRLKERWIHGDATARLDDHLRADIGLAHAPRAITLDPMLRAWAR